MSKESRFSSVGSLAVMCLAYSVISVFVMFFALSAFVNAAGAQEQPRFVFRAQTAGVLSVGTAPGAPGGGGAPEIPAPGDSAPEDDEEDEGEGRPPVRESAAPSDIDIYRVSEDIDHQAFPELMGGDRFNVRVYAANTNSSLPAIEPRFEVDFGPYGKVAATCNGDEIAPYDEIICSASITLTQSEVDALEVHREGIELYHVVGPFALEMTHLNGVAITNYRHTERFREHITLMANLMFGRDVTLRRGDLTVNRNAPDSENPELVQAGDTITLTLTAENTAVHPVRTFKAMGVFPAVLGGEISADCPAYIPAGETISCAATLTLTEAHMTGDPLRLDVLLVAEIGRSSDFISGPAVNIQLGH